MAGHVGPTLAQRGADGIHVGPTWDQRRLLSGKDCQSGMGHGLQLARWAKYRLEYPRVVTNSGRTWPVGISTVFILLSVPLHSLNGRQMGCARTLWKSLAAKLVLELADRITIRFFDTDGGLMSSVQMFETEFTLFYMIFWVWINLLSYNGWLCLCGCRGSFIMEAVVFWHIDNG